MNSMAQNFRSRAHKVPYVLSECKVVLAEIIFWWHRMPCFSCVGDKYLRRNCTGSDAFAIVVTVIFTHAVQQLISATGQTNTKHPHKPDPKPRLYVKLKPKRCHCSKLPVGCSPNRRPDITTAARSQPCPGRTCLFFSSSTLHMAQRK